MTTADTQARPQLGKRFLVTGSKMAAIPLIFGLSGIIYFIAISAYDDQVGAAYGVALTVTAAVTMLGAGIFVYAMHRLPGEGLHHPDAREQLAHTGGAVVAAISVLTVILLLAGLVLTTLDDTGYLAATYWPRMVGAMFFPMQGILTAALVLADKEGAALRTTVENFGLHFTVAISIWYLHPSPHVALMTIGGAMGLVTLFTLLRKWLRLGKDRWLINRALREGAATFLLAPWAHVRSHPKTLAGAADGIIMMFTFAVVTSLMAQSKPVEALTTAALITVIRTFMLPMKQFGIVAAKQLRRETQVDSARQIKLYVSIASALLLPVAALMFVAPGSLLTLLGASATTVAMEWAVRLCAIALLLEPITGCLASAFKIVIRPTANLGTLAVVMLLGVIPAVTLAALWWGLTMLVAWSILLIARAIFAARVIVQYYSWRRDCLTSPPTQPHRNPVPA
ncbi:hypothetical protein [Natronoglycomyces albus]|uniref:Uncharacterized protein n=1 Tax=Natronoglycomyces albus TaxID=2811108 RepID=A0A895XJY7_9ACTN|nr:hypothetical protein [Natronoglycomyces albus]QSB05337.1 hypothetical protein JQS30_16570 [Natronoglycomyces albus]